MTTSSRKMDHIRICLEKDVNLSIGHLMMLY